MTKLGVIADDFTGATDMAINLKDAGYSPIIVFETNDLPVDLQTDAIIVASKIRSLPKTEALEKVAEIFDYLHRAEVEQLYFKYCSTFDSTPEGNIGPIGEWLVEATGAPGTIYCPAFPDAGRTVYQGHLFVFDQLLSESPMAHHPLNPMTDSNLARWLGAQVTGKVAAVSLDDVHRGAAHLKDVIDQHFTEGTQHLVVDAISNQDLETIVEATQHLPVVTGGSGLALGMSGQRLDQNVTVHAEGDAGFVLSGSAAQATRQQVRAGLATGAGYQLDAQKLLDNFDQETTEISQRMLASEKKPFVVYTVGDENAQLDLSHAALFERAIGEIAKKLVAENVDSLLIAGGETSGAVVESLNVQYLQIGPIAGTGVAWARSTTSDGSQLNLLLKSGNFGAPDLFVEAWSLLQ